jgi:hypothetical protein
VGGGGWRREYPTPLNQGKIFGAYVPSYDEVGILIGNIGWAVVIQFPFPSGVYPSGHKQSYSTSS